MNLSKAKIELVVLLFCSLSTVYSQDSTKNEFRPKFGATYNVSTGLFYAHAIGAFTTLRDKHQIELNALLVPGVNPF
ncbi:MAG: hypothetical protein N3F09_08115, partial [Bacteroidia bacterium]|nr:hypothetical protein [Bacteroidia bacterium]